MNKKKPLSVLVALILALSIITTISTGASAASVDLAAVANSARLSFTDINGNEYVWEEDLSAKPEIVSVITEIHNVSGELVLPTYLTGYADDICIDGGDQFYFADSAFDTVNKNIPITSINFSQMYDSFGFDRFMDDIDHFMDVCPTLQTVIGLDDTYVKKDGAFQNNEYVWEHEPSEGSYVSVITEVHNVTDALVLPKYLGSYEYYFADDAFSTVDSDHPINLIDFSQMYGSFCFDRFMDNIDHFMEVCPELQTIIGHGVSYTKQDGVFCLNATPDEATPDESYIELNGGRLYYDSYDGSCSYTRAEGLTGDVVIPDHINGCPVVYEKPTPTIDDCPELTSLTVPDIGSVYISNCPKLKSITFLGEDPVIDGNYIKDCPNLERIDTPDCDDLRCENSLLCNGSRLILAMGKSGDYTIPGDITVIEEHAFSNCPDLNSVTIPASVTEWTAAFAGLEKLKEVTLCDGVTNIGFSAFFDCGSLEKINIPDSVNRIGYWAFMDCVNLKQINIPFSVTEVLDGAFLDCGLSEVTLYPEVTKIGERAFGFGGLDWSKNDDFVIKGVAGSAAEEYAIKCDFAFVPLTEVKSGDIDGDNEVSVIDVTFIQRKLADIPISFEFNDEIADVDGDKIVTILDVTMVQRWLVGLKTNSRVGDTILA